MANAIADGTMDVIGFIVDTLKQGASNLHHNTTHAFDNMAAKDYIRLVMVIGAYMLLRPHIMKFGQRHQMKLHEKEGAEDVGTELSANDLREGGKRMLGRVAIPGVDENSDEESEPKPAQWGKKARVRQRKFIRTAIEKQEQKLAEEQADEEDKDIAEFLTE